jgi:hypothetical protein
MVGSEVVASIFLFHIEANASFDQMCDDELFKTDTIQYVVYSSL